MIFDVITATRDQLDLCDQRAVFDYLSSNKPAAVIIAAAKVGGIHANSTYPADFIYENLTIAANLVEGSRRAGVKRVLFLGSSCIYPKLAPQPMPEDSLLSSALEPTNEAYAIAKITGWQPAIPFKDGLAAAYQDFKASLAAGEARL